MYGLSIGRTGATGLEIALKHAASLCLLGVELLIKKTRSQWGWKHGSAG